MVRIRKQSRSAQCGDARCSDFQPSETLNWPKKPQQRIRLPLCAFLTVPACTDVGKNEKPHRFPFLNGAPKRREGKVVVGSSRFRKGGRILWSWCDGNSSMRCKSIPILNHSSTVLRFPMKGKCFYYKGGGPKEGGGERKKKPSGCGCVWGVWGNL